MACMERKINVENGRKFYTHEEMLDRVIGEKGTTRRDAHDEAINSYLMGEAVKRIR